MSFRRAVLLSVLVGVAACSQTPDRPTTAVSPTSPTLVNAQPGAVKTAAAGSLLTAPVPAAGKFDAVFPSRSLTFDFYQRLIGVYQNVLRQGPIALFVDVEGQVVWVQEFARYIANGCDVGTATQRVFAQIDGQPAGALCNPPPSTAIVQFPPRDVTLAFILLLDLKYQQMGRGAFLSPVDREGIVVWLLEYLRYSVNGCNHEEASANTLVQLTGRVGPPPVCRKATCLYTPSDHPRPSGAGGTFTVLMFRREGDCDWKASTTSSFIHLQTTSGTFSGPLTFTVDPNSGQSRRGTILVEWDGGSTEVVVDQSGANFQVNVQLFDFNKQAGATTECDIVLPSHQCTFKAVTFMQQGAANFAWSAVYTYGNTTKTANQSGASDTFVITEACGGSGSTAGGNVAEVVVTLTVTDTTNATASVTTGQGGHPSLFFRFRTCS
jgi:hypothetical protein